MTRKEIWNSVLEQWFSRVEQASQMNLPWALPLRDRDLIYKGEGGRDIFVRTDADRSRSAQFVVATDACLVLLGHGLPPTRYLDTHFIDWEEITAISTRPYDERES